MAIGMRFIEFIRYVQPYLSWLPFAPVPQFETAETAVIVTSVGMENVCYGHANHNTFTEERFI